MLACLAVILNSTALVCPRAQSPESSPNGNVAAQAASSQMLFTVVDKDSHFVNTLQAEDVRVLVDDKPQQITSFRRLDDQPLTVAILIDNSVSQEQTLPNQKLAAAAFVQEIMRQGRDQAEVATFTSEVTVEQDLTKDLDRVQQAIARLKFVPPPGYVGGGTVVLGRTAPPKSAAMPVGTAIWDAIWATCEELSLPASAGTRKAIVLLSDGDDTASQMKMHEAIERACGTNVAVYSLGIGDRYTFDLNKGALRKLSEQTGGRAFFPIKSVELEAALAEIKQELRYQYEIAYRSETSRPSLPRKVRLEILNPSLRAKDLKISYQRIALGREVVRGK